MARALDALGLLKIAVSELGGQERCAYCHGDLGEEPKAACFGCLAQHHHDCLLEHGACAACGRAPKVMPVVGDERTPPPRYQRAAEGRTPRPGYASDHLSRRYRIVVLDASGREHNFFLRGRNNASVRERLRRRGLVALTVEQVEGPAETLPALGGSGSRLARYAGEALVIAVLVYIGVYLVFLVVYSSKH